VADRVFRRSKVLSAILSTILYNMTLTLKHLPLALRRNALV